MSDLPILGFGIAGHRSFKGNPQFLGPLKKINIIIGENNSGKSNVLRFIRKVYGPVSRREPVKDGAVDRPSGGAPVETVPILIKTDSESLRERFQSLRQRPDLVGVVQEAVDHRYNNAPPDHFWIDVRRQNGTAASDHYRAYRGSGRDSQVQSAWALITGRGGGGPEHWFSGLLEALWDNAVERVSPQFIPTSRRVPSNLTAFHEEYSPPAKDDPNLIAELASYAHPEHTRHQDRAKFETVQRFVRKVLKRPEVSISIQHDKQTINVEDYGRYLPIEALGTGVHQVVLLAVRAVLTSKSVICMEEPELHLHPELQHQLMHFLARETDNQYFITTHSATVMDAVDADVYSVKLAEDGFSLIEKPLVRGDRRAICHALGYRPSDLLQANSLVWVEGPSDRIYLLKWLEKKAPELEEGWHFSVVFYGGRLLSNLSAEETALADFIALLPINRFAAILIDSDKKNRQAKINDTKTRIEHEFNKLSHAYVWITKGREIENYLTREFREKAVKDVHGEKATILDEDDVFGRPLAFSDDPLRGRLDKLAIARSACEKPLKTDVLDLDEKLDGLIEFIRRANRMDTMGGNLGSS